MDLSLNLGQSVGTASRHGLKVIQAKHILGVRVQGQANYCLIAGWQDQRDSNGQHHHHQQAANDGVLVAQEQMPDLPQRYLSVRIVEYPAKLAIRLALDHWMSDLSFYDCVCRFHL